ncbi:MAG: hypothetical protein AAB229_01820 [Candidatus Hydrogenedentota bacterium]
MLRLGRFLLLLAIFVAAMPLIHTHELEAARGDHDAERDAHEGSCLLTVLQKCCAQPDLPALLADDPVFLSWMPVAAFADAEAADILDFSSLRSPPLA